MEQQTMNMKSKSLEYKMAQLDRLATIRVYYPNMTDDQIAQHFPELTEFLGIDTGSIASLGI